QTGLVDDGGPEIKPALHAAGESGHPVARAIGKADGGQRVLDAISQEGVLDAVKLAEKTQVFACRQFVVDRQLLGNQADQTPYFAIASVQEPTQEGGGTETRVQEAREDGKQ